MLATKIAKLQVIDENFIALDKALQILEKTRAWWDTLKLSDSRYKKLKQKGFSGEIMKSEIEVISYQDWLALTAYLAGQPNQKAVQILQAYASYGFAIFHQKD